MYAQETGGTADLGFRFHGYAQKRENLVEACRGIDWCLDCIAPPWNYQVLAEKNPFAAQVLAPGDL
jgi:hypothetical protein